MATLIISEAYPKQNTPYLGIWAHQSAMAVKGLGIDMRVVSSVPWIPGPLGWFSQKLRTYHEVPHAQILDGVQVFHPRVPRFRHYSPMSNLLYRFEPHLDWFFSASTVHRLVREANITFCHSHGTVPSGYVAWQLKRTYGIPYAVTIHGFHRYSIPSGPLSKLGRRILNDAEVIIAVSSKTRDAVSHLVSDPTKVRVIFNGFVAPEMQAKSDSAPALGLTVLSVGSLHRSKGHAQLIEAIARLRPRYSDLTLQIVGSGECEAELRELALKLGVSDRVTFYGTLNHHDVLGLMQACTLFALPSWEEAMGVVYLEAMACGKPCIGTLNEGISDIIVDGHNGLLVPPHEVDPLCNALDRLLSDEGLRETIGRRGYETVWGVCSMNAHALALSEVYQSRGR